jgi:hypothetical protein
MTPLQLLPSAPRPMVRLTALVPLKDNDGRPFPPEYFLALQQFLVRFARGFQEHGLVFGRWANTNGELFTDDCTPFVITCDADLAARLHRDLDVLVRTLFEQQAAYIEMGDVRVSNF